MADLEDRDRMYKVILVGDSGVGKTSLIMRLCKDDFKSSMTATLGYCNFQYISMLIAHVYSMEPVLMLVESAKGNRLGVDSHSKVVTVNETSCTVQIWDTAGQERFRSIARSYFRRADGVLLLYDCTYENSFLNVREWISAVEDGAGRPLPTMLCANKCDMRETCQKYGKKCVTAEQGKKLAQETKSLFMETSAKLGTNINEAIEDLAKQLLKAEDDEKKMLAFQLTGQLTPDDDAKATSCCGSGGKTA